MNKIFWVTIRFKNNDTRFYTINARSKDHACWEILTTQLSKKQLREVSKVYVDVAKL